MTALDGTAATAAGNTGVAASDGASDARGGRAATAAGNTGVAASDGASDARGGRAATAAGNTGVAASDGASDARGGRAATAAGNTGVAASDGTSDARGGTAATAAGNTGVAASDGTLDARGGTAATAAGNTGVAASDGTADALGGTAATAPGDAAAAVSGARPAAARAGTAATASGDTGVAESGEVGAAASEHPRTAPPRRRHRRPVPWLLAAGLVAALLILVPVAAGIGAYPVPLGDVVASVQHRIGPGGTALDRVAESVLWNVRFPRIVLALLIGASLGCAGALMQGVFGNPLAEPGTIGVSSGAAVGAVACISLGWDFLGTWTLPATAFVAGLGTVLLVYVMSRSGGRTEVVTLILTGIAVNAFAGALIGLFVFLADTAAVNRITFWQLGSLAQATWPKVAVVLPCAALGLAAAPLYARRLDLLALGDRPARHLGVDVERLRFVLMSVVALLTAAAVSVSGVIGFVGLVVPHLLRMVAGPGHRFLLPGSALGGAVVLLAADLAARTIAAPAELPLGVLTALVGSPFFFWLLRRTRRRQGGWA